MQSSPKYLAILFKSIFVLLFLFTSPLLFGQNVNQNYKRALKLLDNGNYVEARDRFESIFDQVDDKNEVASYLSECYLALHQEAQIKSLIYGLEEPDDYNLFDLALAYYYEEQFDSAATVARQINETEDLASKDLQTKIQGSSEFYANEDGILIQNFGKDINSGKREYCSVMYNDYNTLLFTSRGESDEKADFDGMAFESIYLTTIDSVGDWTQPVSVKSNIENEKRHDAPVQIINDGKTMISFHDGKLYESNLEEGVWERSSEIDLNTDLGVVTHCHITEDQQAIFFSSDFMNPGGDLDLYSADKLENGEWSDPKPLVELNTPYDEDAPFLAKDGIFYFSSRGHGSIGGYDVFQTTYDSAGSSWADPISLGYPINTVDEDIYYSMEGKVGYISSTRNEGQGSLDIYRVFLFNKVKVTGKVLDDEGSPIPDVRIDFDYDSSLVYAYTDIKGDYELFLPISTQMHVTFVKDSLNLYEGDYIVNVTFKDKNNNQFSFSITEETEEPINEVSYQVPKGVKKIPIDVKNDFNYNPILAKIPRKLERQWVDSVNNAAETEKAKRDIIEKAREEKDVDTEEVAKTERVDEVVYFKVNSETIESDFLEPLTGLAENIKNAKNVSLLVNGYTDYTGTSSYNLKLSFRRARAVYDYLVSKGVDGDKLRIQALGEIEGTENLSLNRKVEIKWQIDE